MMGGNRHILFIILSALCIAIFTDGCSDKPSEVLDEKRMVSLLADMEIAEAYVNTQTVSNKEKLDFGKKVLEAHGVTEQQLDTTLAWYGRNMDKYSELFDKVDAELLKRKEVYTYDPNQIINLSDNIWPYNSHMLVSPLSGYNDFIFSIENPGLKKGDLIKFSFYLPDPVTIKGTLGVEYEGGEGESAVATFNNKRNVEIQLQPDTSRIISRLYGVMYVKETNSMPVFIDSISIMTEPFDTLSYRVKRHALKSYHRLPHQFVTDSVI